MWVNFKILTELNALDKVGKTSYPASSVDWLDASQLEQSSADVQKVELSWTGFSNRSDFNMKAVQMTTREDEQRENQL